MKILHLMLSCFYVENMTYQENLLPFLNKKNGHEVEIIASKEGFDNNHKHTFIKHKTFMNEHGIKVKRIPYGLPLPNFINRKLRFYKGLFSQIDMFSPNIIFFHGLAGQALFTVSRYIKRNPNVILIADSHEDFNNSGTNWFSLNILHKFFYRTIIKLSLKYIKQIYSITYETTQFIKDVYKIPSNMIEDFPLGGLILSKDQKYKNRIELLRLLNLKDSSIIFFHSGKIDIKKKSILLLDTFSKFKNPNFRLLIAGSIAPELKETFDKYIKADSRIIFLGWLDSVELKKWISGSDLYLQPGGHSATMQLSLCCGTPVATKSFPSHRYLFDYQMPFIDDINDLTFLFNQVNKEYLSKLSAIAYEIASQKLNYENLSNQYIPII